MFSSFFSSNPSSDPSLIAKLNEACISNDPEALKKLLIEFKPKIDWFTWRCASSVDILRILADYAKETVNEGDPSLGRTILHEVLNLELLAFLCNIPGIDLNVRDAVGYTPLHLLARSAADSCNCAEAMKVLVAHGADKDARDRSGSTPLHVAAKHGNTAGVNTLIALGANVNAKTEYEATPLLEVAMSTETRISFQIIEALVTADANINTRHMDGYSAASYVVCQLIGIKIIGVKILFEVSELTGVAASWEQIKVITVKPAWKKQAEDLLNSIRFLIKHGAEVDYSSYNSPIAIARKSFPQLAEILKCESDKVMEPSAEAEITALPAAAGAGADSSASHVASSGLKKVMNAETAKVVISNGPTP